MNALLTSATLIVIASNCAAVTQDGNEEEQQVRAFPTEFDQAVSSRDDEAPKKWK